ncbi:adenylate/guanylate cyclase domain-containing protein [Stappia sp.]|uniref:adenylate/guanylate cyclase domain-containing protein n=1 Tax=Stappia sp. TaxID=1870903 RepID=UPI003C7AEB23
MCAPLQKPEPSEIDALERIEQPFPLMRQFLRRVLPGFAVFLVVLLVLVSYTANRVAKSIYLELAERRAATIARGVATVAPEAWAALLSGRGDASPDLAQAFAGEMRELALGDLKVYDLAGRVLFSSKADEIGARESGAPLRRVLAGEGPVVAVTQTQDGSPRYELYVPFLDDTGRLRAVFELYEPVTYLDALLRRATIPALAVPGLLLLLLAVTLARLVKRAQGEIDARTHALNAMRRRMATFLSRSTVTAAEHSVGDAADIASRKYVTTLFYSDLRGFTAFSEAHAPEDVVAYLNEVMTLQVQEISRHGGDVDKLIGDAVLARFDGEDGSARAIAAARAIQARMVGCTPGPRIGIGLCRGEVILGVVGAPDRRDFTVIGDTVNIAARLSDVALGGEIVATDTLADAAFGAAETVSVKGRSHALQVRRWPAGRQSLR